VGATFDEVFQIAAFSILIILQNCDEHLQVHHVELYLRRFCVAQQGCEEYEEGAKGVAYYLPKLSAPTQYKYI